MPFRSEPVQLARESKLLQIEAASLLIGLTAQQHGPLPSELARELDVLVVSEPPPLFPLRDGEPSPTDLCGLGESLRQR